MPPFAPLASIDPLRSLDPVAAVPQFALRRPTVRERVGTAGNALRRFLPQPLSDEELAAIEPTPIPSGLDPVSASIFAGIAAGQAAQAGRAQARIARRRQALIEQELGPLAANAPEIFAARASSQAASDRDAAERRFGNRRALVAAFAQAAGEIPQDLPQEEQIAQRQALFDQISPLLGSDGLAPEELEGIRNTLVNNPQAAQAFLSGIQATDRNVAQAIATPERLAQGARSLDIRERGLGIAEQRAGTAAQQADIAARRLDASIDPELQGQLAESRGRGTAFGRATGQAEFALPRAEETFAALLSRADQLLNDPDLASVTGFPSIRGITRGGLGGNLPPVPGSPAAVALARLKAAGDQLRLEALESLRGTGPVTEIESEFGANAQAALDRAQSYTALQEELRRLMQRIQRRVRIARQQAAPRRPQAQTTVSDRARAILDRVRGQ